MTDLRAGLVDALRKRMLTTKWKQLRPKDKPGDLIDVLLSLDDIAIVELPEGADVGQGWRQFRNVVVGPDGDIRDEASSYPPMQHNSATARAHAAALLVAANAAESHAQPRNSPT